MTKFLYRPIDAAILTYFRIFAGILLSQELINKIVIGKLSVFTEGAMHFSYLFFPWVKPWGETGMLIHFGITIVAGWCVAFNFKYRLASIVLFLGYTGIFLMEKSDYINHMYLYCLITFWMIFLPLNENKKRQPAWPLYIILFHMSLAYFYAGIAKLNPDWLRGSPMDIYLFNNYGITDHRAALIFSYGGLLFDLIIVPMLLYRKTRTIGFILSCIFHLSNVYTFGLATFPWFSLLLTSMFFNPAWPRYIPILRNYMPDEGERYFSPGRNPFLEFSLFLYVLVQVLLPLRQHLYPGVTSWTENGHMFSWRMMLRNKKGNTSFAVKNSATQEVVEIDPKKYLTDRQVKNLVGDPDLILQFAHYLRDTFQKEWGAPVEVYASSKVSLNGRPYQEMVRPYTNLALEKRSLKYYEWVLPLEIKEN